MFHGSENNPLYHSSLEDFTFELHVFKPSLKTFQWKMLKLIFQVEIISEKKIIEMQFLGGGAINGPPGL